MTVLIAGGGIAGLTLALSLHQIGVPCRVFESAAEIKPLGVGVNLPPHATRELIELGLLDRLDAMGVRTDELVYYSEQGQPIWREPRGVKAGYKWPQFAVHRGLLQQVLLDAVLERIGPASVLTNHHLVGFEQQAGSVHARFYHLHHGTESSLHEGELLVAADGMHSAVRALLFPDEGGPVWSGRILWRGVTLGEPFDVARTTIVSGADKAKFVAFPISRADGDVRPAINWVAERDMGMSYRWRREDYNRRGRVDEFLPRFEAWRYPWLDVHEMIREALYVYEFPLIDRDPLPRWTFGRVTLIGDAAHPMYPIGANGASQAIIDARVLAREILQHRPTEAALEAYEAERRPATAEIVLLNRLNGPDRILPLVQERAPDGFEDVHDVISYEELAEIAEHYKTVSGFSRDALNARASIVPVAPIPC